MSVPALHIAQDPAPELICAASDIFDVQAFDAVLNLAILANDKGARTALLDHLKAAQTDGRASISAAFRKSPFRSRPTTRAYSYLTDCLVAAAFRTAQKLLHPNPTPTTGERIAVLAVGGYGRGEMAPYSDVDLLFLTPYKITPWAESVIEATLYLLWDLKLKVGHSSRTVRDCIRLGAEDFTIRTAMLEHRFLLGDQNLASELDTRLRADLFQGTEREFIRAKLSEREARHRKQGQRYVVEPNVKEGKGGLRDLQSLFWIGKYIYKVQDAAELVPLGLFAADEFRDFVKAEDFLWATRCHLHLLTGRPTDQLSFDMQVAVADAMGYEDKSGRQGVEIFMQAYFREATVVGDLTRIFLTGLEAIHLKDDPLLERLFKRRPRTKPGYQVIH
ncbi:MAG: [protein-PII] uridylyltransferase, partial [Pseudomonadota bacterium]